MPPGSCPPLCPPARLFLLVTPPEPAGARLGPCRAGVCGLQNPWEQGSAISGLVFESCLCGLLTYLF